MKKFNQESMSENSNKTNDRLFTKEELTFLDDVLGHINYDANESDIYWSICAKIKNLEDR